jgi:hypothetical protein
MMFDHQGRPNTEGDAKRMTGKTFTPAEIRQLITDLRQEHLISAREWGEEDASKISTAASRGADALEYLLQFVEWKPFDDKPSEPSLMVYPPDGKTIRIPRYGVGQYSGFGLCDWNWSMPPRFYVPIPPPPEEKEGEC